MKINKLIYASSALAVILLAAACSDELESNMGPDGRLPIAISGEINQLMTTRAGDTGFVDGDVMGIYVVDYDGTQPGTLLSSGNHADNVRHTYNYPERRWDAAHGIYWNDKHTPVDIYGYYPAGSPGDVNAYTFTVQADQLKTYDDGTMGGYEASDFLWGKVAGVAPTSSRIKLSLSHRMATARVTLVEGDGFGEGEWGKTRKQVLVTNTVRDAVIDLSTGEVTPSGEKDPNSIIPFEKNDEWRAIVVPQTMTAGTQLFSININGIPYKYTASEEFAYVAGKMSNFAIKVDKKDGEGEGAYTLTLIAESITPWENDLVSHNAMAFQYLVVDVVTPETLEARIAATGHDISTIKRLKVNGRINSRDIAVMNYLMPALQSLNLKDATISAKSFGPEMPFGHLIEEKNNYQYIYYGGEAGEIPERAFQNKSTLMDLILPDKLKKIGEYAFSECTSLSGSLIIPEGVTEIEERAFFQCSYLTGGLSLPSTLKSIGDYAFCGCSFNGELSMPNSLENIGAGAFSGCFSGELHFPEKLKTLGAYAFSGCSFHSSLEIPQVITEVPDGCFSDCKFEGNLILHNGITSIGSAAFSGCNFKGELVLPEKLEFIGSHAFRSNYFSGELKIPASVEVIPDYAFYGNPRLSGVLELGEGVISIGKNTFEGCSSIEGIIFPSSLENIGERAFMECYNVGSMVCKSTVPPHVEDGAFWGVPKDNFSLEVPEEAVVEYTIDRYWSEFKRIAAHHELVCRPALACALSTERKQTLVIDAEGEWEVESMPDWCELSQRSGSLKTEVTLTIKALSGADREGDVVFRLKDKGYTSSCHVSQYAYQYAEDEYLALQTATRGNRGGINIVILGDGYNAAEIASGKYLADMRQAAEYFFAVEPYTTYRDYFNVYTAFPVSTESGIGSVNTIRYNRFGTTFADSSDWRCDEDELISYVLDAPAVNAANLDETLIIVVPNTGDYDGFTKMWESGMSISFCPLKDDYYPYDARGVVQHEAGGHAFGKLADENVYNSAFLPAASVQKVKDAKIMGWYDNIDVTGKMHQVGWSHLIFDPCYSDIVDIFEGGYGYSRGVYRSEQSSCMRNNIPYFSTISRESIVRRIKKYAGEPFSFEEFVARDNRNAGAVSRGYSLLPDMQSSRRGIPPQIVKGSPLKNLKKGRKIR